MTTVTAEACPKRMVHGPCGGVRPGGACEVAPVPCPFVGLGVAPPWPVAPVVRPAPRSVLLDRARTGPAVLTDLTATSYDRRSTTAALAALRGSCQAVLVAEHHDQPGFPPTLVASVLQDAGVPGWVTLTCRDRNRVVLEQELLGLADVGVDGVLCVTGDARAPGVRAGVTQVFDLDGTRLAAAAAAAGLAVGVVESPEAPPTALRPGRLLAKQHAGAHVAVLNHVASVPALRAFLLAARAAGVTVPVVAAVAVFTDEESAASLQAFPGLHLDPAVVRRVLAAPDPRAAGVEVAVAEAAQLLALPGVVGVNLSGRGASGGALAAAEVKAEVGSRVQELVVRPAAG